MMETSTASADVRRPSRLGRAAAGLAIVVGCLAAFDIVLALTGVFPPRYNFGVPDLGWVPEHNGTMMLDSCRDFTTGGRRHFERNEIGIRTTRSVESIRSDTSSFKVAVVGDSHTDLCAPNDSTHPGVLENSLEGRGVPTIALSFGMGRYSPLQAYLLFESRLTPLGPSALVLNLYTGNDFYDMLREDDRPHLQAISGGYRIEPPNWFVYDDPNQPKWMRESRLLFLLRSIGKSTGISGLATRLSYLTATAATQEQSLRGRLRLTFAYMRDLQRAVEPSIGYPAAIAAQMLNQQLFFHHFPSGSQESLDRLRFLLELAKAKHPDIPLVMSPIPSYLLATSGGRDSAFDATMSRMPFTAEQARERERALYDALRALSRCAGWIFIDNLPGLAEGAGSARLYNGADYHITEAASLIIGDNEARALFKARAVDVPQGSVVAADSCAPQVPESSARGGGGR
jgi:hypothetical protein